MAEARDRLARAVGIAAIFTRQRQIVRETGVLLDEPATTTASLFGSPTPTRGPMGVTALRGRGTARGSFGTPRMGRGARGRNLNGTPSTTGRRGGGRPSGLPSWYPRVPLQDITLILRAGERRRARLGEIEGQQTESPIPQLQRVLDPSLPISGAQLEHDISMISPNPTIGIRPGAPSVVKVQKFLLDVASQSGGESEFLTPQKKLLNSIDTVEKVVMEELHKLKRTPSAKKAEREKRVRTLMSMR